MQLKWHSVLLTGRSYNSYFTCPIVGLYQQFVLHWFIWYTHIRLKQSHKRRKKKRTLSMNKINKECFHLSLNVFERWRDEQILTNKKVLLIKQNEKNKQNKASKSGFGVRSCFLPPDIHVVMVEFFNVEPPFHSHTRKCHYFEISNKLMSGLWKPINW